LRFVCLRVPTERRRPAAVGRATRLSVSRAHWASSARYSANGGETPPLQESNPTVSRIVSGAPRSSDSGFGCWARARN